MNFETRVASVPEAGEREPFVWLIPPTLYDELWALEVDTTEAGEADGSPYPADRVAFAEAIAMADEVTSPRGYYRAELTEAACRYAVSRSGALDNSIDIWRDNLGDSERTLTLSSFIRSAKSADQKIRAWLGEEDRG